MSSTWSGSNLIGGKQRSQQRGTILSNSLKYYKCPYKNYKIPIVLHELYNNIYTIFKVYLYLYMYASLHNGLQKNIYCLSTCAIVRDERCDMLTECGKNQHCIKVSKHVVSPYFFGGNTLPIHKLIIKITSYICMLNSHMCRSVL